MSYDEQDIKEINKGRRNEKKDGTDNLNESGVTNSENDKDGDSKRQSALTTDQRKKENRLAISVDQQKATNEMLKKKR